MASRQFRFLPICEEQDYTSCRFHLARLDWLLGFVSGSYGHLLFTTGVPKGLTRNGCCFIVFCFTRLAEGLE